MWNIEIRGKSKKDAKQQLTDHAHAKVAPASILAVLHDAVDSLGKPIGDGKEILIHSYGHSNIDPKGQLFECNNVLIFVGYADAKP